MRVRLVPRVVLVGCLWGLTTFRLVITISTLGRVRLRRVLSSTWVSCGLTGNCVSPSFMGASRWVPLRVLTLCKAWQFLAISPDEGGLGSGNLGTLGNFRLPTWSSVLVSVSCSTLGLAKLGSLL